MEVGLVHYLTVAAVMFGFGLLTVMTRKNAVGILLGVELILNAAALNFIAFEHFVVGGVGAECALLAWSPGVAVVICLTRRAALTITQLRTLGRIVARRARTAVCRGQLVQPVPAR